MKLTERKLRGGLEPSRSTTTTPAPSSPDFNLLAVVANQVLNVWRPILSEPLLRKKATIDGLELSIHTTYKERLQSLERRLTQLKDFPGLTWESTATTLRIIVDAWDNTCYSSTTDAITWEFRTLARELKLLDSFRHLRNRYNAHIDTLASQLRHPLGFPHSCVRSFS